MEKYNFDFIFAPVDRQEQVHRMKYAIIGFEEQIKDAAKRFANGFVDSEMTDPAHRFQHIEEIEQCMGALLKDQRTTDLGKWVAQKNASKLSTSLAEVITEMLNRK